MAKVHEQDHDDDDNPDNPEPDLDNHHPDDSYPMQDSDIEELLETCGHDSARMYVMCEGLPVMRRLLGHM